jgi:hypothetical protein
MQQIEFLEDCIFFKITDFKENRNIMKDIMQIENGKIFLSGKSDWNE